jgi:tetratricopeptide (TPR) repeat protein
MHIYSHACTHTCTHTHTYAHIQDLHAFLGIPDYNKEVKHEQEEIASREQIRANTAADDKPETHLRAIERAKSARDRRAEARAFNALGLLYCEHGLETQGEECLESALELCRAEDDTEGIIRVLNNLGCVHNLLECQDLAIESFQEVHTLLDGDPMAQADVKMRLALTCAANGDNYEAVEHALQSYKVCKQLADSVREASCLFALGSIYYEAGEVRACHVLLCMCMYVYLCRGRSRAYARRHVCLCLEVFIMKRARCVFCECLCGCGCMCVYIYIYIYT